MGLTIAALTAAGLPSWGRAAQPAPPASPLAPKSFVLFQSLSETLLPIGCYNSVTSQYAGDCEKLVRPAMRVTELSGATVTLDKLAEINFCSYYPQVSARGIKIGAWSAAGKSRAGGAVNWYGQNRQPPRLVRCLRTK